MIRAAIIAAALAGCATDPPAEPQIYSCVILYRCAGDADITARLAQPCAADDDEATDLAMDAGLTLVAQRCPGSWQYVRPLCEPYAPETACATERSR